MSIDAPVAILEKHVIPAGMIVCMCATFRPGKSQVLSVGVPYYLPRRDSMGCYEDLLNTLREWFQVDLPNEADADIMLNITPGAEFVTVAKMTTAMIPDVLSDATICDHVYIEGGFKPTIYLSKGAWPMGISPAVDD